MFAIMLCVCVAFAACGKDPDPEPDPPKPSTSLESLTLTEPTVKATDRQITDKAGEFGYSNDKVEAKLTMTFKNATPATKDSTVTLSQIAYNVKWLTTPAKVTLTGDIVLTPTLSGTNKLALKYGTLEVKDFFTVTNATLSFTRSGKTAKIEDFGFKVEAVGNATNVVTYVTESGKTYEVNTLTQPFKLTHKDGTSKDITIPVIEARKDITGVKPTLVSLTEKSSKPEVFNPGDGSRFKYTYTVTRNYSDGAAKDTTFSWYPEAKYSYRVLDNITISSYTSIVYDRYEYNTGGSSSTIVTDFGDNVSVKSYTGGILGIHLKSEAEGIALQIESYAFTYKEGGKSLDLTYFKPIYVHHSFQQKTAPVDDDGTGKRLRATYAVNFYLYLKEGDNSTRIVSSPDLYFYVNLK